VDRHDAFIASEPLQIKASEAIRRLASRGQKGNVGEEPRSVAFFRKRYESEDQQRLAELTKQLASAVSRQCAADRRGEDQIERSRDSIYRQLLFE
jgi:hypothetical protein